MGSMHAYRRETPPGEGDPMDGVEYTTVSEISSTQGQEQQEEVDESFGQLSEEDSDEDDGDDPFTGWQEILAQDIDNPPAEAGPNATTMGFEFELLVAVARAQENFPDPHPNDGRWLSDRLINKDHNSLSYKYTVRNKIIDQLLAGGLYAHKTDETWWDAVQGENFEMWDSLEYENPNQNDQVVLNWVGEYQWNGVESDDYNVNEAVKVLQGQFVEYHANNNIELYLTTEDVIKQCRDNLFFMIQGLSTTSGRKMVVEQWYASVSSLVRARKRKHYSPSEDYRDPISVPLPGASKTYAAWSCTDDISIQDPFQDSDDYLVPHGSVPFIPNSVATWADPPDLYKWFGAEVVSPILDYDNPLTRQALRTACTTLREELRIHKPMAEVKTGVHIHIGQQAGWTLLHLKKIATLWHLMEPGMYQLHRKDRISNVWCSPMATTCRLASCVFTMSGNTQYLSRTTGPLMKAYQAQMQRYVPPIQRPKLLQFFSNIWQYAAISDLNAAMGSGNLSQGCVRWRIHGNKRSRPLSRFETTQTLEFRLMQGTFDAEHIWKWASICERLVIFARDSTPEDFRDTIQHLLDGSYPHLIGFNRADMDWFISRSRDGYFAYPELDGKVDWTDPFMIRGYRDTHDAALNV